MQYLPEIRHYENLEFFAQQVVEGFITGMHKSPYHGFSVEFAEHRLYNAGESTKNIDWKLYARTDKMFVKRYEEETNLRCHLVIDRSSSMYYPERKDWDFQQPNKIQFSALAAAALATLFKKQRDAVGLSWFDEVLGLHSPAKSSGMHHHFVMQELEQLINHSLAEEQRKSFTVEALHQIAENIHQRSLVILFSDMQESREQQQALYDALHHLRYNKHEVIVFHVMDGDQEMDLNFENRLHRFIDKETGESLKLNPFQLKEAYQKQLQSFVQEVKEQCLSHRIDYLQVDAQKGFHPLLMHYLAKRQKMIR